MNEIQKIQYDMLIELDQVCRKHGLTYYLAYGTCLGAVRDIQFAVEKLGIDDDCVVMAGDNVMNSCDSRYWGVVPEEYIVGVVQKVIRD